MPAIKRQKTSYPGVFFIEGVSSATGKTERIYYIRYRKNGKIIEEKAGYQLEDDMTPARANRKRALRIIGDELSNADRRQAEKAAKEAIDNKLTISKLWEKYLMQRPDLKGITTDKNRYENYIRPTLGDKEPSDLLPLDVDRLRLKLLKTRKPGTVKNVLELLRRIINFGVKKRLCEGAKFKIEMPSVNNLKTEDLSPDQLSSLLKAIEKDTHLQAGNMMLLTLYTGMRRGEMFRLQWKDIDFERGFINLINPKGGKDQRIPLNEAGRGLLNSIKRTSSYVFPGRKDKQRTDIHKAVNAIRDKAGLPKTFRALHGLRHVYASMLASSGQVDLFTLQRLLTHKSPLMTQRYAHLRDEAIKKAASVAGEIIENARISIMEEKKEANR